MAEQHIDSKSARRLPWRAGIPGAATDTTSPTTEPASTVLSYDSYLRVKSGISDSVLVIAGLPPAEKLSYEAYVAALGGKVQPQPTRRISSAMNSQAPKAIKASGRTSGVSGSAWTRHYVLAVAGAAIVLVAVFVIGVFNGHIFAGDRVSSGEANVVSAQTSGGSIMLAVTQVDELLTTPILNDLEQVAPLPTISVPNLTPIAELATPGEADTKISPPTKASKKISKSAVGGTKKATETPAKLATAKVAGQSTKPVSSSEPKTVSAKSTKVVRAETDATPAPLRWLDDVFDSLSENLGGTDGSTRRKVPAGGDRENKR